MAPIDVVVVLGVALGSTLFVFFGYRPLLFSTFDPEVAEVSGVRTARVDIGLAVMLTATIAATMNVIGVTMMIGRFLAFSCSIAIRTSSRVVVASHAVYAARNMVPAAVPASEKSCQSNR